MAPFVDVNFMLAPAPFLVTIGLQAKQYFNRAATAAGVTADGELAEDQEGTTDGGLQEGV
eukprot:COSAG01_NODE_33497_length_563_cov_0.879310_1_plen_60_part_00